MKRGSKAWMHEHVTDPYVKRARAEGWRSRAAFKLDEIDRRDRLLRPGMLIVDLGAAPGGWSQLAAQRVQPGGRVIAVDLIDLQPLPYVEFVRGDFAEEECLTRVVQSMDGRQADLVLSDMAPNVSGIAVTDAARMSRLAALALEFACTRLRSGGNLLVKVFHGRGFDELRAEMARVFETVAVRKPVASRDRSSEVYLLGRDKR